MAAPQQRLERLSVKLRKELVFFKVGRGMDKGTELSKRLNKIMIKEDFSLHKNGINDEGVG